MPSRLNTRALCSHRFNYPLKIELCTKWEYRKWSKKKREKSKFVCILYANKNQSILNSYNQNE